MSRRASFLCSNVVSRRNTMREKGLLHSLALEQVDVAARRHLLQEQFNGSATAGFSSWLQSRGRCISRKRLSLVVASFYVRLVTECGLRHAEAPRFLSALVPGVSAAHPVIL